MPRAHRAGEVLDVAAGEGGSWVLTGAALEQVSGARIVRGVPLVDVALPASSAPQLVVDPEADRMWIITATVDASELVEFDELTVRKMRTVTWPQRVQDAVAYRDHLYVSTTLGVADLAPGSPAPRLIPGLGDAVGPLAVDPTRQRLVAIDLGYPTLVWTYRPGRPPVQSGARLRFGGGTLTVVAGTIWVGGFKQREAALERLDPRTLQPIRHGDTAPFGPGAHIVAGGDTVFWVRPGNGTDVLACLDAQSGRVEQTWQIASVSGVASDRGGALVATPSGVLGLVLSGCRG